MKLIFAGTPAFAAQALQGLIDSAHSVELVLTQPDRPAGRGKKLKASAVKQLAVSNGIPVEQPLSLKDPAAWASLKAIKPDALIVAAYGLILPLAVLEIPKFGGLNIHASLLPRWRGAAPIQRAIEAGDTETGVCIMQMEAGLDTGPVWLERRCRIGPDDTGGMLHDKLAALGSAALLEALPLIEQAALRPTAQPLEGITYAEKIHAGQRQLNFTRTASQLHNQIRAFDPAPGTSAALNTPDHTRLKIWRSAIGQAGESPTGQPGSVVLATADQVSVQCGDNTVLDLLELQRPGGQRLPVARFQQSPHAVQAGDSFILEP
ncbi:MAG: methionyl-tRNA formyltransferase [Burkholderiaceae bacterium]